VVVTLTGLTIRHRDLISPLAAGHRFPARLKKSGAESPTAHSQGTLSARRQQRETILVACSKCDWRAAFSRDELIAAHGADYAMPNLLDHLAAPSCSRLGSNWDRCGVNYVEPIEGELWAKVGDGVKG